MAMSDIKLVGKIRNLLMTIQQGSICSSSVSWAGALDEAVTFSRRNQGCWTLVMCGGDDGAEMIGLSQG